jgi:hypothetical protein
MLKPIVPEVKTDCVGTPALGCPAERSEAQVTKGGYAARCLKL